MRRVLPEARTPPAPPRRDREAGLPELALRAVPDVLVTVFLMVLYLRTLLPSIGYAMDTSKFGYLGQVLGTGHPPGEPLYLMLNAGWVQLLPFGNPAWRANLLSAAIAVVTCLVLIRVLRELGVGHVIAAAGAAMIGVSRLFWQQSIIAEVYSLNALFTAIELYLLLRWWRTGRDGLLIAALGVFELSFSNHPTGLFLLPGLTVFLITTRGYRVALRPKNLLILFGCGLLTLSTWGYIVWRSLDPATPYVELDIHNLTSFWDGITAQQFQSSIFAYSPWQFVTGQVPYALSHFWLQYFALAAAGVWGFGVLIRRRGQAAVLTGLWALAVGVFAMGYRVFDAEVFYYVTWMMLGLWITVGLADLARRVPRLLSARPRLRPLGALPLVLALVAPLALAGVNYARVDLSDNDAHDKLSAVATNLPAHSIIFTPSFLQYQGLNYFLIPGGKGREDHIYADLGAGSVTDDTDYTALGGFLRYCRSNGPVELEWIRQTVHPDGLKVFVYGEDYARDVATYGFPVHKVADNLYRTTCSRFGPIGT